MCVAFVSCDKDENSSNSGSIVGTWKKVSVYHFVIVDGEEISEPDTDTGLNQITFKADGTWSTKSNSGTYELDGDQLVRYHQEGENVEGEGEVVTDDFTVESITGDDMIFREYFDDNEGYLHNFKRVK